MSRAPHPELVEHMFLGQDFPAERRWGRVQAHHSKRREQTLPAIAATLLAFEHLSFVSAFDRGGDYCAGVPDGFSPRHEYANRDCRCRFCGEYP